MSHELDAAQAALDTLAAKQVTLEQKLTLDETTIVNLTSRLVKEEKQTMINTVAIAGMTNNSGPGGTPPPPPPSTRTLLFPHARFRYIVRDPSRSNATDRAWYNSHMSDIHDGSSNGTLIGHPYAIEVQSYMLLARLEVDTGGVFSSAGLGSWSPAYDESSNPSGACDHWATTYATANGKNVEDYWLHAMVGQQNYAVGMWSITTAGVIKFVGSTVALLTSFPFTVGQTISIAGLPTGSGTYTIASLQKNGVTLGDYSGAAYGPTTAPTKASTAKIGTFYIAGDGTFTKANRRWEFYFSEWRNRPWFGNADCRQMHAARIAFCVSGRGDPSRAINCAFFDEMESGEYTVGNVTSVEYGTTGGAAFGSAVVVPFSTDMSKCLVEMLAYPGGPKFIRANTSGYAFAPDAQVARAAGGIHGEQLLNRFASGTTGFDYYVARVNEGVDVEFVDGGIWKQASANGGVTPVPGIWLEHAGTIPGNYPDVSKKGQMSSYALYLLGVDVTQTNPDGTTYKHAIFDLCNSTNPGDIPASARWALGYEYNIGQPAGQRVKSAILTDPAGLSTQTITRSFSLDGGTTLSAWVGYVTAVSGQTNWGVTSQMALTPPAAPAGKAWYMLNWDGTLGTTPLTVAVLARSEGIIFVAA